MLEMKKGVMKSHLKLRGQKEAVTKPRPFEVGPISRHFLTNFDVFKFKMLVMKNEAGLP